MFEALAVSPWLPVILSGLVLLIGIGVQLAAFAYFTGRMKGGQDATNALVSGLISRMDSFDRGALSRAEEKGDLSARLDHVEKNTNAVAGMAKDLTRLDERFAGFERRASDRDEIYRTHFDSIQRQIAALATGSAGTVVELPARPPARARVRPPAES